MFRRFGLNPLFTVKFGFEEIEEYQRNPQKRSPIVVRICSAIQHTRATKKSEKNTRNKDSTLIEKLQNHENHKRTSFAE